MKRVLILLAVVVVSSWCLALNVSAQQGTITIEQIEGRGVYGHDTVQAGANLRIVLRYINDTGEKCNIANGWKISSPDAADWDSVTMDSAGILVAGENKFILYFNQVFAFQTGTVAGGDGTNPDTVGVLAAGNPGSLSKQMPNGFNDTALAIIIWFNGNVVNTNRKHICIDTAFWGVGGTWVWVGQNPANNYYPTFVGETGVPRIPIDTNTQGPQGIGSGYCYVMYDPAVDVADNAGNLPKVFAVSQNYPNPFNPTTKIKYEVPRASKVNLTVYNVLGQKVVTLVDRTMAPGRYTAEWDATNNASGIYFFKFEAGSYVQTKKMVLMK